MKVLTYLHNVADNNYTDLGMVTSNKKKYTNKEQMIGSSKICESTVSAPDSHINSKKAGEEHSLSDVWDVIKRRNEISEWLTVIPG